MSKRSGFNFKTGFIVLATAIVTTVTATVDINGLLYYTSILDYPEHKPFDGTVYPLKKVPDWVHLSEEERAKTYAELPPEKLVDLPVYRPEELAVSTDSLTWGDPAGNKIRNAKITYSVPYLGNYTFDGRENVGSHPAVDIKIPVGTPVYAMANGTVIKSSDQSSGFGHHIVIMHNNFPSPDSVDSATVVYSSYSHLSTLLVDVGDVVNKGGQIAESGVSGTATTPHLHFQLDRDVAPWHPYWPFSWSEVSEAGLDFFSAVNSGFGIENARLTTINPMLYVQSYLNESTVTASGETNGYNASSYVEPDEPEVVELVAATDVVVSDETVVDSPVVDSEPVIDSEAVVDAEAVVDSEPVIEPVIDAEVVIDADPIAVSETETLFSDVPVDHEYYDAVKHLASAGIIEGHADGTFKPGDEVNRVEALKFILEVIDAELSSGDIFFVDVSPTAWYAQYLYTGVSDGVVEGNPDGTFRPASAVNKAEFFKILFKGMSVDVDPLVVVAPYQDVSPDEWFASYIAYAKELGLLDPDLSLINPEAAMTRGEVADAIYRLMKVLQ